MTNEIETIKAPQDYLPEDQAQAVSKDLAHAISIAKSIKVTNEAAMEEANGFAGKIRARQKGLEAFRLAIVKPFKDHIAKIDKFFKDKQKEFDEPLETIEGKVIAYRETRKAPLAKSSYQEGVGRTSFIKTAEFEIKDRASVPTEFWTIDEKKLGARVREITSELEVGKVYTDKIKGVEIKCTERASYVGEK